MQHNIYIYGIIIKKCVQKQNNVYDYVSQHGHYVVDVAECVQSTKHIVSYSQHGRFVVDVAKCGAGVRRGAHNAWQECVAATYQKTKQKPTLFFSTWTCCRRCCKMRANKQYEVYDYFLNMDVMSSMFQNACKHTIQN